jgi:uracil-DNA glycosylase
MSWNDFIIEEKKKDYYKKLEEKVEEAYKNSVCYPAYENIFNAFKLTSVEDLKVVILGQDPYHEPNQAHGLSFSVLCEKLPPSLVNIYKEIASDLGVEVKQDGNLDYLAKQGVLLLNTILTVEHGKALAHKSFGWEKFTDNVIKYINTLDKPIVYILWGSNAISKTKMITNPKHYVITSVHPSPLSSYRGFFGSKPFSKTNEFLKNNNIEEINWVKTQ